MKTRKPLVRKIESFKPNKQGTLNSKVLMEKSRQDVPTWYSQWSEKLV